MARCREVEIFNWVSTHIGLIASFVTSATVIIAAVMKTKNAIISSIDNMLDKKLNRFVS